MRIDVGCPTRCVIVLVYSDRSACSTSTRDARAAGISDATTAAPMSTAAAPSTGSAPGSCTFSTNARRHARERVAARRAGDDPDRGDQRALRQDARQQVPRRRADRQPHAELARARAHRERQHARHADDGDQQRDAGESGEHEGVQPLRRQHFRAHVLERRGALHRLVRGDLADDARHRRHERVRIARRVHEQAAGDAHLPDRVIDRQRRSRHDVLVVHVGDDADDAAGTGFP